MDDYLLKKQIEDLQTLLSKEEEVYAIASSLKMDFHTLRNLRLRINQLKADLQVLLERDSA